MNETAVMSLDKYKNRYFSEEVTQSTLKVLPDAPQQFLNIGSSYNFKPRSLGWVNIDILPIPGVDFTCDAVEMPFEDNTFFEVALEHVYEHFDEPLKVMEEVWRVSKPDALVTIRCPYYRHLDAFGDPGHKHFINEQSFVYLENSNYGGKNCMTQYPHKFNFKIVNMMRIPDPSMNHPGFDQYRDVIWGVIKEIICVLKVVK